MPVTPLKQLAGAKIPFTMIEWLFPHEKRVVHFNLGPLVRRTRATRNRPLGRLCDCGENGECLCYFGIIRHDQIEQFWATEDDYRYLGDWLRND